MKLLKSTMDKDLTEDLTQETFLKMIRNIERFDPDGRAGFGTWLVTIAKNSYIDHLRRNRIFLENIEEVSLPDGKDITGAVEQKLQYQEMQAAIDTLPPEQGWRSG